MRANATHLLGEGRYGSGVRAGHWVVAAWGAVILALVVHFAFYSRYALTAIFYPFELDYGEGIVWQQALLIPGERMYGDITRFPFIVFHYPPLYHLVVRAAAAMGFDMLVAGRAISVLCTLLTAGLVAALSHEVAGRRYGRTASLIGSAVAGLTVFCYWPVVVWSPLMRVDMLAIMLSFLGFWLAVRSFRHPWLLYLAVLAFVLAVYTKQTAVAAPLAVLLVSLATDRRRALQAFGLGLVLGLAGLLALTWVTDGGFVRHILFYNLNRFTLGAVVSSLLEEAPQTLFLVAAFGGLAAGWRGSMNGPGWKSPVSFVRTISRDAAARPISVVTLYLVLATAMLGTLGKSGAVLNYLIEWMCLWSVLIGVLVASVLGPLFAEGRRADENSVWEKWSVSAFLAPAAILGQILIMPAARDFNGTGAERTGQLNTLVDRINHSPRPVLSDDMVLLMKAGKPVPWEPAIFAELASTGRWDQRPIVRMIAAGDFAFVITQGHSGQWLYDSRFTPGVDAAIRQAYPRIEEVAGRTLHLPPE